MLSKEEISRLYRKRAKNYDLSANLYYILGFREQAYRRMAVEALDLRRGATVLEICCGTGLNFSLIQKKIGPEGKLIGIDLTDEMLAQANKRALREGWNNVELIQTDAAKYLFPKNLNGIISTFALTLVPEYEELIMRGAKALSPGGRMVILDLKKPDRWPIWVVRLGAYMTAPFGVSLDLMDRHPWEAVNRYLTDTRFLELYGGFAYISSGAAK